jgi:transitional endoplasmic reticulum ATPase
MDGIQSRGKLVVIGATNRPNAIDPALGRPGRFDRILEVPAPDAEARKEIIKIHTVKKPHDTSVDLDKLVETTDGMTGADIAAVVNAAAMAAINEQIFAGGNGQIKITNGHFEKALQKIKRKVGVVRDTLA